MRGVSGSFGGDGDAGLCDPSESSCSPCEACANTWRSSSTFSYVPACESASVVAKVWGGEYVKCECVRTFSASCLYCVISLASCDTPGRACPVSRFIATIPSTALRTMQHIALASAPQLITSKRNKTTNDDLHVFLALNTFWMLGNKSVGPPVGLSGSGTKCGCSDASHLCCSASAAVGRDVGSTVRHTLTKSRAVSETFAQYSALRWEGRLAGHVTRLDRKEAHRVRI